MCLRDGVVVVSSGRSFQSGARAKSREAFLIWSGSVLRGSIRLACSYWKDGVMFDDGVVLGIARRKKTVGE